MQWIDVKYIGALAPRLSMFTRKHETLWNMRCPICGDSRKSKTKARGYILGRDGKFIYTCHNCNVTMPFSKFLEQVDPNAYNDYRRETFLERKGSTERIVEPEPDISRFITPKFIKYTALSGLKKISQLPVEHPAKRYVVGRKIPPHMHSKLFYAPKFKAWTNTIIPNKFDLSNKDEPRLIIPFVDQNGNLFGYQGRAFFDVDLRYITIMLDEEKPKVYGLERLDVRKKVFVVEGPIDSMFLSNCIAMGSSHLDRASQRLGITPSNTVVVYDNEPRNKNIVSAIEKCINAGYNVCIWPDTVTHKDINEMICGGLSSSDIHNIIENNTFKDLTARLRLSQWKKI